MRTFNRVDRDFIATLSFRTEINLLLDALKDQVFHMSEYVGDHLVFKAFSTFQDEKKRMADRIPPSIPPSGRRLSHFWGISPYGGRVSHSWEMEDRRCRDKAYLERMEEAEPILKNIAEQRNKLREKLNAYFQLLRPYMPDKIPSTLDEQLRFGDLSLKATLQAQFAIYLSADFQKNIFEQIVYRNDRLASPQVVTVILRNELWELFDMPNRVVHPLALSFALLTAVSDGEVLHVQKLLAHGARSGNAIDSEGQTTLHLAMKHETALLKLLLEHDDTLNFHSKNVDGMTALELGYACQNVEAIAVLERHLGNVLADELERPAFHAMFLLILQQKQAMAENVRLQMESLHLLQSVVHSQQTVLQGLQEENKVRKTALSMQFESFVLERENLLHQGEEALLKAKRADMQAALAELNYIHTEAERTLETERKRPQREEAERRQREETQAMAHCQELELEKTRERAKDREALLNELRSRDDFLKTEMEEFFCSSDKKKTLKVESDLLSKMIVLLGDAEQLSSAKHEALSDLLKEPKYAPIVKDACAIRDLVRSVLRFFANVPCDVQLGIPVLGLGYPSRVPFFPPVSRSTARAVHHHGALPTL